MRRILCVDVISRLKLQTQLHKSEALYKNRIFSVITGKKRPHVIISQLFPNINFGLNCVNFNKIQVFLSSEEPATKPSQQLCLV